MCIFYHSWDSKSSNLNDFSNNIIKLTLLHIIHRIIRLHFEYNHFLVRLSIKQHLTVTTDIIIIYIPQVILFVIANSLEFGGNCSWRMRTAQHYLSVTLHTPEWRMTADRSNAAQFLFRECFLCVVYKLIGCLKFNDGAISRTRGIRKYFEGK